MGTGQPLGGPPAVLLGPLSEVDKIGSRWQSSGRKRLLNGARPQPRGEVAGRSGDVPDPAPAGVDQVLDGKPRAPPASSEVTDTSRGSVEGAIA